MKFKRLFLLAIGAAFLLTSAGKPMATANEIVGIKENVTQQVMRLANLASDEEETEDPEEILSRAIEDYKEEFDDYINITALNVEQKELVTLPNFDIDYIAPTYAEVMNEYQINLEASLTPIQLEKYDLLRQRDYNFDKYVALNQNKYLDLTIPPKYNHVTTMAVVTTALVGILSGAGLTQAAISAFTGAVGTLSAAISTAWIPIVGWALAVGLAVGALIALTVIIVQYWDEICSVINDIKNWFLEQFNAFADLINSYFNDAIAQGEESTIAEREIIDGKEIVWKDANMTRDVAISIATDLRRNSKSVLLMKNISFPRQNEMNWWIPTGYVDVDFVTKNKLCEYPYYYSTYTWYNSTAKRMLFESTPSYSNYGNYGYKNLVYHKFTNMKYAVYGWNHYHVGKYDPIKQKAVTYPEEEDIHSVHSFFGLTYIRLANNQGFVSYPANP